MLLCLSPLNLWPGNFPGAADWGLCSITGICVQPSLVYLLSLPPLASLRTEPGSEEASVNAFRIEVTI